MRLPRPFQRLSVRFDADRMREEIERMPLSAWAAHPNDIPGNSSIRLISVNGAQNDDVNGRMAMTPNLAKSRICVRFSAVSAWCGPLAPHAPRTRGLGAAARGRHYHWFSRVRLHIPS